MAATYTFDVFSSLDGFASYGPGGDWGGYWGKQGPQFLDHRLALYGPEQRMAFGATTFRQFVQMLSSSTEDSDVRDAWVRRMRSLPATVVSTTLEEPLDWLHASVAGGDAVEVVAALKQGSEVPLRSHGSLALNRALMAAGLVDRLQVTIFPVITGRTGAAPIFAGAADFDLQLLGSTTFEGGIQESAAHGGGRAGVVGDALVAGAEDQDLDEVVEDDGVVDARAVFPRKREVPPPSGWVSMPAGWARSTRARNCSRTGSRMDDGRAGTGKPPGRRASAAP